MGIITESDIFRTFMELFASREKGLRITLECPYRAGELAKITKAIADLGGDISSCGTFQLEDTSQAGVVLKIRNVDSEILTATLSKIGELAIIDNREM